MIRKRFTIRVLPEILFDWGTAAITVSGGPGSTGAFSPSGVSGRKAVAEAVLSGRGVVAAQNEGRLLWSSNEILPVKMQVEVNATGVPPNPVLLWAVYLQDDDTREILVYETDQTFQLNQSFSFPFNLPNTGGSPHTISWSQTALVASSPDNDGSLKVTATLLLN